jgi:glycosyltransferase involved in cell wall biosynthesis
MPPLLTGKRILILQGTLDLGGAERYAFNLARYFKNEHQAEVNVWAFEHSSNTTPLTRLLDDHDIPWKSLGWSLPRGRRYILRLLKWAWIIRRFQPDIIFSFLQEPNIVSGIVGPFVGAKASVWNQQNDGREHQGTYFEALAAKRTPYFVSNSQIGAEYIRQQFKIAPHKIYLIHNSIQIGQPEISREQWRKILETNEEIPVATMTGNLTHYKDHETLLRAWSQVLENQPVILALAGYFGDRAELLQNLAKDLKIEAYVRFLGQVNDISGLLQASNIGILSSPSEGSPNAVMEYMFSKLPVVATDLPGIREIVGADYGYLAPIGNSTILAEHVLSLVQAPQLSAQIGNEMYQKALANFTPQKFEENIGELLKDILNSYHKRM